MFYVLLVYPTYKFSKLCVFMVTVSLHLPVNCEHARVGIFEAMMLRPASSTLHFKIVSGWFDSSFDSGERKRQQLNFDNYVEYEMCPCI